MVGLALAASLSGCGQRPPDPVAPFGGALATTLPYRDVIGFLRFRPDNPRRPAWLGSMGAEATEAAMRSLAGPPLFVLQAARAGSLLPAGGSLAVLLLDPSVHGALCAFAWRGDAAEFLGHARVAGIRVEGSRVWLPGRGRVEGFNELARDVATSALSLQRMHDDASDRTAEGLATIRYEVIEQDGLALLLPARDGAMHLLAALRATQLLDPATGDGACLRLELGAAASEMKKELRDQLMNFASSSIWEYAFQNSGESGWRRAHELYDPLFDVAQNAIYGAIEALVSIEHVFVQEVGDRFDLFVRAEPGKFFGEASTIWVDRPWSELLAGAPPTAPLLVATALDAATVGELPAMLRRAQDEAFGRGGGRRRRSRQRALEAAADEANERARAATVEVVAVDESFLDTFGGRLWLAVGPPPERVRSPSLLDALGFGKARPGSGDGLTPDATDAASDDAASDPWCGRLFTEFTDEEASHGAVDALLNDMLPDSVMTLVRAAVVPTDLYSVQRVERGCIEAVGSEASGIANAERIRLETENAAAFDVPAGMPDRASALLRFAPEGDAPARWLTLERVESGLLLHGWWSAH